MSLLELPGPAPAVGDNPDTGPGLSLAPVWVLVTGWRYWPAEDRHIVWGALDATAASLPDRPVVVMEGDCPFGGVDRHARDWANRNHPRARAETHNPERFGTGPERYTARNSHMVRLLAERREAGGAVSWLAFPGPERPGGTWDCMKKLILDFGIPGTVYPYPHDLWEQRRRERPGRMGDRQPRQGGLW